MRFFSKKSSSPSATPLDEAAFRRRLREIEARGEADRRQIAKDKDRRAHELCPWSTGVALDA